jgi:hypothetical protein
MPSNRLPTPARTLVPLLACLALATSATHARSGDYQRQISRSVEAALLDLGARDALGETGQPLKISQPAQVRYELGAIVDVQSAGNGLQVLAVTPGGAAERIGLQAGDRLLGINGSRLTAAADAGAALEAAMADSNGRLRLDIVRGDRSLRLSGAADVAAIPAYELTIGADHSGGCGYVTDQLGVPSRSQYLYDALITRIDGRSTPLIRRPNRYRLDAGRHVLIIGEQIVDRYRFNGTERRHLSLARTRSTADERYKTLVVDVEPGYSYRIGVELLEHELDPESIRAHEYWRPVVYDKVAADCE